MFELRTKEHIELFFNNDNDDDVSSDNNVLRSKIKDFETKINVINHNESHIRILMDDTGDTTTTTTTTKSIAMIYDQKFRYRPVDRNNNTESNNTSLITLSKIVTAPFSTIELRAQYTETLKNDTLLDNNINAFANLASVQPPTFESVEEEVADDDDDDASNDKWPFLRNGFFMAITIAIVMLLIVVGFLSRGYRFRDGSFSRYNAEDFVTPPVANPNPDLVRRNPSG